MERESEEGERERGEGGERERERSSDSTSVAREEGSRNGGKRYEYSRRHGSSGFLLFRFYSMEYVRRMEAQRRMFFQHVPPPPPPPPPAAISDDVARVQSEMVLQGPPCHYLRRRAQNPTRDSNAYVTLLMLDDVHVSKIDLHGDASETYDVGSSLLVMAKREQTHGISASRNSRWLPYQCRLQLCGLNRAPVGVRLEGSREDPLELWQEATREGSAIHITLPQETIFDNPMRLMVHVSEDQRRPLARSIALGRFLSQTGTLSDIVHDVQASNAPRRLIQSGDTIGIVACIWRVDLETLAQQHIAGIGDGDRIAKITLGSPHSWLPFGVQQQLEGMARHPRGSRVVVTLSVPWALQSDGDTAEAVYIYEIAVHKVKKRRPRIAPRLHTNTDDVASSSTSHEPVYASESTADVMGDLRRALEARRAVLRSSGGRRDQSSDAPASGRDHQPDFELRHTVSELFEGDGSSSGLDWGSAESRDPFADVQPARHRPATPSAQVPPPPPPPPPPVERYDYLRNDRGEYSSNDREDEIEMRELDIWLDDAPSSVSGPSRGTTARRSEDVDIFASEELPTKECIVVNEDEVEEELMCCVCFAPFVEPVCHRACGHVFCSTCLRAAGQCPVCRGTTYPWGNHTSPPSRPFLSLLDKIRVRCVECSEEMARSAWPCHQASLCPTACEMCGERLTDNGEAHAAVCPAVLVPCAAAEVGCTWRGTRQLSAAHEQECVLEKVRPMVLAQREFVVGLQEKLEEQSSIIMRLNLEVAELRRHASSV